MQETLPVSVFYELTGSDEAFQFLATELHGTREEGPVKSGVEDHDKVEPALRISPLPNLFGVRVCR